MTREEFLSHYARETHYGCFQGDDNSYYKSMRDAVRTIDETTKLQGLHCEGYGQVVPNIFDQIEINDKVVFGRIEHRYFVLYKEGNGCYCTDEMNDNGFFAKDNKFGWRNGEHIVIPALYDVPIHQMVDGIDAYQVEQNGRTFYINSQQVEILTEVRHIDNDNNDLPFCFWTHSLCALTVIEFLDRQEKHPNVVDYKGSPIKLDRISKEEVSKLLQQDTQILPLTPKDVKRFCDDYTYETMVYKVKGHNIMDCMHKLSVWPIHCNTWYYLIKLSFPKGELPQAEDLRALRYYMEDLDHQALDYRVGIGEDATLQKEEVAMLMVTHYYEHCWPSGLNCNWHEAVYNGSLEEVKKTYEEAINEIKNATDKDMKYDGEMELNCTFLNWHLSDMKRSWRETRKVLNFLRDKGIRYKECGLRLMKTITITCTWDSISKMRFYCRILRWMVENGAEMNMLGEQTILDCLNDFLKNNNKSSLGRNWKSRIKIAEDLRTWLIAQGAMTKQQMREAEKDNINLQTELSILKK